MIFLRKKKEKRKEKSKRVKKKTNLSKLRQRGAWLALLAKPNGVHCCRERINRVDRERICRDRSIVTFMLPETPQWIVCIVCIACKAWDSFPTAECRNSLFMQRRPSFFDIFSFFLSFFFGAGERGKWRWRWREKQEKIQRRQPLRKGLGGSRWQHFCLTSRSGRGFMVSRSRNVGYCRGRNTMIDRLV